MLTEYAHLLPLGGTALDLACGLGANALFLAGRGLDTQAWDISAVAIARLTGWAAERDLAIRTEVRDVTRYPPGPGRFDAIVVSHFLERRLCPALAAALRPGGVIFYQTFTRARVGPAGPRNDAYRLGDNELLGLFSDLRIIAYREEALYGDIRRGFRNEALLVAAGN